MEGTAVRGKERTDEEARNADKERRLAELRRRLDRLTDITDESERFRVRRMIYDLERGLDEDEWPDELAV